MAKSREPWARGVRGAAVWASAPSGPGSRLPWPDRPQGLRVRRPCRRILDLEEAPGVTVPAATGSLLRGALPCSKSSGLSWASGMEPSPGRPALTLSGGRSNRPLSLLGREVTGLLSPGLGTWAPGVAHWSMTSSPFLLQVRESGIPSPRLPPPKVDFKSRTSRGAHGPTCSSF